MIPKNKKANIFLISTPFHYKTITMLMKPKEKNIIIVLNRIPGKQYNFECQNIILDISCITKFPILNQFNIFKKINDTLSELQKKHNDVELYYPNDDAIEYQFAISFFRKNMKNTYNIMYEDGIGAQICRECFSLMDNIKSRFKKYIYSMIFSKHYFNVNGFRGSLADKYFGFSDSSFKEEREQFDRPFEKMDLHAVYPEIDKVKDLETEQHIFLTEVLVEDRVIKIDDWNDYLFHIGKEISQVTDILYLKFHPRESANKIENTINILGRFFKKVECIQNTSTIEEYVGQFKNKDIITLYGSRTGGLYYTKELYPEINIKLFFDNLEHKNRWLDCYINSFRKII